MEKIRSSIPSIPKFLEKLHRNPNNTELGIASYGYLAIAILYLFMNTATYFIFVLFFASFYICTFNINVIA